MKKNFLGKEVDIKPHKIVRELVNYMLEVNRPLSIKQLMDKLLETNSENNLRTRINRCLTNTPDVVNERDSTQSRIYSIPLHYKNIEVFQEGDKFSLKLSSGSSPEVRETNFTNKDLQNYLENKTIAQSNPKYLEKFIKHYKALIQDEIEEVEYNELYKWETIQYFQDNWKDDFDETNILQNLNDSFNYKNNNLWSGSHYLPYKAIKGYAEVQPRKVAEMFRTLFDESKDLQDRFMFFETSAEEILLEEHPDKKWDHYQSRRAMVLYLCLKYPNKYFLYKNGMFNDFCKITKFWPAFGAAKKKDYTVIDDYFKMCAALKEILEQDEELLSIHKGRLPEEISFNDDNNVLVQDFIYAIATYLNPDNYNMNVAIENESLDEERLIIILKEIGLNDSQNFYDIMGQILSELSIKSGDERICYSLPKSNNRIGLTFGQKLCAVIDRKKDKNRFRYFDTTKNETDWLKEANNIKAMEGALDTILISATNELSKTVKTSYGAHSSVSLEKSLFDKDYKKYIFQKAFNKAIKTDNMSTDLNQIFFGPPGTGKTYHTINEAIKIVDPEFFEAHHDHREKLKERFKLLLLNNDNEDLGQIGFTTFHQSFSYEDFIEGIKPIEPKEGDTHLKYDIQEGIFKRVCRLADDSLEAVSIHSESLISLSQEEYNKAHFYKMSLGNTQDEADNEVYDYCIENNVITIGFGNGLDFTGKNEKELRAFGEENDLDSYPVTAMNLFSNYLKVDDYVVISYGNLYVRAIAKVTGDYEYREESPFPNNSDWKHFRKVEWIFKNKKIGVKEIYNKNLSQQTIYKLEKKEIKPEFFVKEKNANPLNLPKNPKNFVIIIDEINRGNVSSIFGELITLIEKDKRAGKDEELSATLPYSKKEFKVPHNVFIIGTMNTADRSIEALDTALRRRFSFREMPPKHNLILTEGELKNSKGMIGNIDVVKILKTINDRIEKLIDKDHKIGHSYFLNIKTEEDLKTVFKDEVIPLLEEYFFGDFGKISLVLGSSFITKGTKSGVTFAKSNEYDPSIANDLLERSVYEVTSKDDWNFKAIYE